MAVPQRRTSKTVKRKRRTHQKLVETRAKEELSRMRSE